PWCSRRRSQEWRGGPRDFSSLFHPFPTATGRCPAQAFSLPLSGGGGLSSGRCRGPSFWFAWGNTFDSSPTGGVWWKACATSSACCCFAAALSASSASSCASNSESSEKAAVALLRAPCYSSAVNLAAGNHLRRVGLQQKLITLLPTQSRIGRQTEQRALRG